MLLKPKRTLPCTTRIRSVRRFEWLPRVAGTFHAAKTE